MDGVVDDVRIAIGLRESSSPRNTGLYHRWVQAIEVQAIQFDAFGSHGVTISHPIEPASDPANPTVLCGGGPAQVVTALLAAGGKIGRHLATRPQLLMVVSGELQIIGPEDRTLMLFAGQAVLFEAGEQQESVAHTLVTLAIMEYTHPEP